MAVTTVPPAGNYDATNANTRRRDRGFAGIYEQARRAATNDNPGANNPQDNAAQTAADGQNDNNLKYISTLHDRVDTLRGEILVRVIQSGQTQGQDAVNATGDISRLSTRLDTLRKKLQQEETRLSGKLIDVEV